MGSDKYTRSGPGQHGRFKIYRNDKFMGSFETFEDCELVCHMLNRGEKAEHLKIQAQHIIDFIENECISLEFKSANANRQFLEIIESLKHMEP